TVLDHVINDDKPTGWLSFGRRPRYNQNERHPYKLSLRGKNVKEIIPIESSSDYNNLSKKIDLEILKTYRLTFFHTASPAVLNGQGSSFAITADCSTKYFSQLVSGSDWLVSHANVIFTLMQAPPSCIILEPMMDN